MDEETRQAPAASTSIIDPNFVIDAAEALGRREFAFIHSGKTRPESYRIVRTLAKGGYGEVYIVEKEGRIYAMKKVPKDLVRKNPNTTFFMNEKTVMTELSSEWIVHCHAALQDASFLYYIMDFIPGGDLLCYLSRMDRISEADIRFYAAELFMAVTAMHSAGWIHRDLKPDNILIDVSGHIKLGDFGSCIKMTNGVAESSITVGTPDYLSPDLLVTVGNSVLYGQEVDFWTIGVIVYEMLYGTTPFYSESLKETYRKIAAIDFNFPGPISEDLKRLLLDLLCRPENRIGLAQVKAHPFFKGVDWENLRKMTPPYIPKIAEEGDISNFIDTGFIPDHSAVDCGFTDFVGFTHDSSHSGFVIKAILANCQDEEAATEISLVNTDCKRASHTNSALGCAGCAKAGAPSNSLETEDDLVERQIITREGLRRLEEELSQKEALLSQHERMLETAVEQIGARREEYNDTTEEVRQAKEELANIRTEISVKIASLSNLKITDDSHASNLQAKEEVADLKRMIERAKFGEVVNNLKKMAYWFYKQSSELRKELEMRNADLDAENRGVDELKKQLRLKRIEIRECQQKMEQEMIGRRQLEDQLRALKATIKNRVVAEGRTVSFILTNVLNNKEVCLEVSGDAMTVKEYADSAKSVFTTLSYPLNSTHIRELKNNEMHYLSVKKRALCAKIFLLGEIARSSTSGTRRSLNALEKDFEKETKILEGLHRLIGVLDGPTLQDALAQRTGSEKKLKELQDEIERAKKSTIKEHEVPDDANVAEFHNHLFYEQTVAKGTLCDHCNEVLYGVYKQAYVCKDCFLVVHKSCYVLVDVSCELNKAMRAGKSICVQCRSTEEKDKLLQLNKL